MGGNPIVAIRTASHGFQNFLELDKEVLGGNYHGHHGGSSRGELNAPTQTAKTVDEWKEHPIVNDIRRLRSRYSLYKTGPVADDVKVLMHSEIPGEPKQPAVWVREHNGARVFYSQLGGWRDFENASFKTMIARALFWTEKRELEAKPLPPVPELPPKKHSEFTLPLRSRVQPFKGSAIWHEVNLEQSFDGGETAVVICDVWDKHWCPDANARVKKMVGKMNQVVKACRESGMLIVHAPSDTMAYYDDWPQRRRMKELEKVESPHVVEIDAGPQPIDSSDGGCDTEGLPEYGAWTSQIRDIEIGEYDAISDNGDEVYSLFAKRGIKNMILLGVHTNMCVLNRSFATAPMTQRGINVVLVRDLTDAMYNPKKPPYVTHDEGTRLIIEYIEKHYASTVTADGILKAMKALP